MVTALSAGSTLTILALNAACFGVGLFVVLKTNWWVGIPVIQRGALKMHQRNVIIT